MLVPLLILLRPPAQDGLDRFHNFMLAAKRFSVKVKARAEGAPLTGTGTLIVSKPDSFKLSLTWGQYDYNLIKKGDSELEFERFSRTYQEYRGDPGLNVEHTIFSALQDGSLPIVLLRGDLRQFAPKNAAFKVTTQAGVETYSTTWTGGQGSEGKLIASIAKDGRLTHFDYLEKSPNGILHRVQDFSEYVFNPPIAPSTFSTLPPVGYSSYSVPLISPQFEVGSHLSLGIWKSKSGSMSLDRVARGKLLIVRDIDSPPADGLIGFLSAQKLPIGTVVASIGASGGQYWSPSPKVATDLSSMGTPLLILLGSDGKIKNLWLGFDPDKGKELVQAISEAVAGKSGG